MNGRHKLGQTLYLNENPALTLLEPRSQPKRLESPPQVPNMAPLLAAQPLKAIYTTYILLTVPVRAIYLYPKYLVKPLYPGWTASMSLISSLLDLFFHYCTVTRSRHVLEYVAACCVFSLLALYLLQESSSPAARIPPLCEAQQKWRAWFLFKTTLCPGCCILPILN